MTLHQTARPNRIALHAGKQNACSAEVGALAQVFKESATEPKPKPNLLRYKSIVNIVTFNDRTLNTVNQLPELTASAAKHNIDIIRVQERRYYHSKLGIKYHNAGNGWVFLAVSA